MLPELLLAAAAVSLPSPVCPDCAPGSTVQGPPAPLPPSSPVESGRGRWFAGLSAERSTLSRGRDGTWQRREAFVGVRSARGALTLSGEWQRRFGLCDAIIQLRGERGWSGGSAYLALLATPHADFAETWGLRGGGEAKLARALDLTVDARLSHYPTGTSESLAAGPRVRLRSSRASVRLRAIGQRDEVGRLRLGWAADGGIAAASRLDLAAGLARYPETDAGVTRRTSTQFVSLAWRALAGLTVRGSFEREDRARSYRRDSTSLGVALDF